MSSSRAVVLVHGIFESSSAMKSLRHVLESQGFRVYAPDLAPHDGSASIAFLAERLAAFIEETLASDESFSIVAFSMGGLTSRYYLQRLNGVSRAQTFITLGTPHRGSALAFFRTGEGFRDLRQGSSLLKTLRANEDSLRPLNPLSIYTPFDLMIVPYSSSIWRVAQNLSLPIATHCGLLSSPRVHRVVLAHLSKTSE
ncbi:MAG: alpha/beta fold hydrolase [Chloroherpetonaceae bacterium]|nr:alpha/beta fold hydrolase [Chloroherpetonaceae bacterium]MDW8438566.1 alpha/beta fold hydrolase [Chloroherpetonaceae bacterium]